MGRAHWLKIIVGSCLVLIGIGANCRSSSRAQIVNELRICGDVFENDKNVISRQNAMIKMRFKGAQTSDNGAKAYPFETVDNLSLGETVRLDRGGRFCTGVIKLDNYYRPATMQILSLSITIGDRAVEGRLAEGDIEGPEHNTLELWAEFNFSKPFDNTMSRFMSDQAEEIFGTDRKIASKMEHPEKEKEKKPSQVKIKAAKSR